MYFTVQQAKNGQFYWTLKAGNHEVVATSEQYTTKASCMKTIDSIKSKGIDNNTEVKDLTQA